MKPEKKMMTKTMRLDLPAEDSLQIRQRMLLLPERDTDQVLTDPPKKSLGSPDIVEFFENSYDGVLIAEPAGIIREANPRSVQFLRYPREELCKMFIDQVISGIDAKMLEAVDAALQTNRHVFIQGYCIRQDATTFPVDIAVSRMVFAQKNYLCFLLRDVSLRHKTEELLRREHHALCSLTDGMLIVDESGIIMFSNPAALALWGFDPDTSLEDGDLASLVLETDKLQQAMNRVASGETWGGVIKIAATNQDGSPVFVGMTISPTYDHENVCNGAVLLLSHAIG